MTRSGSTNILEHQDGRGGKAEGSGNSSIEVMCGDVVTKSCSLIEGKILGAFSIRKETKGKDGIGLRVEIEGHLQSFLENHTRTKSVRPRACVRRVVGAPAFLRTQATISAVVRPPAANQIQIKAHSKTNH